MTELLHDATPRRAFVSRLAAATATAAAAVALPARGFAAAPAPAPAAKPGDWDMRWVDRLSSPHRQVFDMPVLEEGMGLHQVNAWMAGYKDVYGESTPLDAVLVVRHFAVPLVMKDQMWNDYDIANTLATMGAAKEPMKDPATGAPAKRNPYVTANVKEGDQYKSMYLWPNGTVDAMIANGLTVLVCNMALSYFAENLIAKKDGTTPDAALTKLKANLLPGVFVMPNGIFAVGRAEEAGCRYVYSA